MKFSIVLNEQMDVGVQLNALGHVSVGLAHQGPSDDQALRAFSDREGRFVGLMSDHPLIVLAGRNSDKLRAAYEAVLEARLVCNAFVLDMKDGQPLDQQSQIRAKSASDLLFVAVGCLGEGEVMKQAFRRFSLYR